MKKPRPLSDALPMKPRDFQKTNSKIMLETESVSLVLTPLSPLEDHQCSLLRPTEN
jgi:hypothetical protein